MNNRFHPQVIAASLDADGCLFNANYHLTNNLELKDSDQIINANSALSEFLKLTLNNNEYQKKIILCGSLRQDQKIDYSNSLANMTESIFTELQRYVTYLSKDIKDLTLDKYLLADIHGLGYPGYSFDKAIGFIIDQFKHPAAIPDPSKKGLLYAQMHKLASENPDSEIIYHFIDDKLSIHLGIEQYYSKHPEAMPANLKLATHHYEGNAVTCRKVIQGKGIIDYDYEEGYLSLVNNRELLYFFDLNKFRELRPKRAYSIPQLKPKMPVYEHELPLATLKTILNKENANTTSSKSGMNGIFSSILYSNGIFSSHLYGSDSKERLDLFFQMGCNINQRVSHRIAPLAASALHLAIFMNDYENLKNIIELSKKYGQLIDYDMLNDHGETPLILAKKMNFNEATVLLLAEREKGAHFNINIVAKHGYSALHFAVALRQLTSVKALISAGAKLEITDKNQRTPLDLLTLELNGMLADMFSDDGVEDLQWCETLGFIKNIIELEILGIMLDAHANANTLFKHYLSYKKMNGIKLILDKQPSLVHIKGNGNRQLTALHFATETGNLQMCKLLIEKKADLNAVDSKGNTALHLAVQISTLEVIECLFSYPALMTLKNSDDKTAYQLIHEGLNPLANTYRNKIASLVDNWIKINEPSVNDNTYNRNRLWSETQEKPHHHDENQPFTENEEQADKNIRQKLAL